MTASAIVLMAAEVVLGVAAVLAVLRIVRGPTLLDRMVASDVLLTTLMIVLAAEAVVSGQPELVPVLLVLAGAASLGTIAVARSVSAQDRAEDAPPSEPLATRDERHP